MIEIIDISRDLMIRGGLLICLLGIVWAMVSLELLSIRGNRFTDASDDDSGNWYVTKVGAALMIAIGAAIFGFGLTM